MASRATVMTGMYEYKTGGNFQTGLLSAGDWNNLAYPVQLRKAGYRTAFAGKWGFPLDVSDYAEQFDKWGGFAGAGQGSYVTARNLSLRPYAEKYPHVTRALGAFGREFIRDSVRGQEPFCLSLSFKAPHKPHNTIDPEDRKLYEGTKLPKPENWGPAYLEKLPIQPKLGRQYLQRSEWDAEHYDDHIRRYYQLISGVDSAVGMVLEELERRGVADNTVVIYTSDNGYFCGAHGLQGKVLPYDDASLIPLIIYDPRFHAGQKQLTSNAVTGNVDFAPTILDLARLPIPERMDGRSLVPLIKRSSEKIHESVLVIQNWGVANDDHTKGLAVIAKNWKYIVWCYADENVPPAEELFDLKEDMLETRNLIAEPEMRPILERMRKLYDAHHEHWSKHCVNDEDYARHRQIFDRHIGWREKDYRGYDFRSVKESEKLKAAYKELTGKVPARSELR
jgi:arylsulfatase A-like enzyme